MDCIYWMAVRSLAIVLKMLLCSTRLQNRNDCAVIVLACAADEIDVLGAADDDDDQQAEEVPTKVIREQVTLQIAVTAQLLDGFTGGSDRSSVCTIAAAIAPRALVLVGGSETQTAEMARESSKMLSKQQTRVLQPGEESVMSVIHGHSTSKQHWQYMQHLLQYRSISSAFCSTACIFLEAVQMQQNDCSVSRFSCSVQHFRQQLKALRGSGHPRRLEVTPVTPCAILKPSLVTTKLV